MLGPRWIMSSGQTLQDLPTINSNAPLLPSAPVSSPPILACLWHTCNTAHSFTGIVTHWKIVHLPSINALKKLQSASNKTCFCLWSRCCKPFKGPSDLDRHVQSVHLGLHFNCSVLECTNNKGRGFARADKLRAHEKGVHGFL